MNCDPIRGVCEGARIDSGGSPRQARMLDFYILTGRRE